MGESAKSRLSTHQWEVVWEEKLGEREAVGLGMTARENLIQYLRKIGDQLSREVRQDKRYREGVAGAREFRGVAMWEEAHEVVKEFEAMNAGQRALQNSCETTGAASTETGASIATKRGLSRRRERRRRKPTKPKDSSAAASSSGKGKSKGKKDKDKGSDKGGGVIPTLKG